MLHDNSFTEIFTRQQELMARYHTIEARNGLLTYSTLPADLNNPFAQMRLKYLAWCFVEELVEAAEVATTPTLLHEELMDALHFLVELLITSGIQPGHLPQFETTFGEDARMEPPAQLLLESYAFSATKEVGLAMHLLKNRSWKQTTTVTDEATYRYKLMKAVLAFGVLCQEAGMGADQVYAGYLGKAAINQQRQDGGQ